MAQVKIVSKFNNLEIFTLQTILSNFYFLMGIWMSPTWAYLEYFLSHARKSFSSPNRCYLTYLYLQHPGGHLPTQKKAYGHAY